MKTIHDYLDSLFLNVPITPETRKAKEDLSAIMEDHYHELISQGKSEHEAMMSKHDEIRKNLIDSNPEGEQREQ